MLFRLTPFETSTPAGLSHERYRRMALTTITAVAARGTGVLAMLISVPLTFHYLGAERFGLWMTLGSFVAFLGFSDLGIGNGLLNGISEANGRQDEALAQRYVSSSFFMLCGIMIGLVAVGSLAHTLIPWARLFKVSSELAAQEAGPALAVFAGCVALSIPLATVQKVQQGYQEGYASNLWQLAGRIAGLIGIILSVRLKAGLPWLVLAMAGAPVVVTGLNWLYYFSVQRPSLFPSTAHFEWKTSLKLANVGGGVLLAGCLRL
jgi:O-antigen/teichoic acid export membrane protein